MKQAIRLATVTVTAMGMAGSARAAVSTYVDTFDNPATTAQWSFGGPNQVTPTGGNGGAFFESVSPEGPLDTVGPKLYVGVGVSSPFTGNYVAQGVTSIGLDLKTFHTDFSIADENGVTDPAFSLTLQLVRENGTPFDPTDDDYAILVGSPVPGGPDAGWVHYEFAIPSDYVGSAGSTPGSWHGYRWGENNYGFAAGVNFQDVLANVDHVELSWLDPEYFAIFQQWDVGVDNVSITTSVVPEPASLGMIAMGGIAMLGRRGRKSM